MGTPAGPAFHFTVTQYIQEGVFLLTPVPQNFQFLKGKDMFPTLKMNVCCQQYLLPEKQLSHVKTPPWKPRGNLEPASRGGPACPPGPGSHRY